MGGEEGDGGTVIGERKEDEGRDGLCPFLACCRVGPP